MPEKGKGSKILKQLIAKSSVLDHVLSNRSVLHIYLSGVDKSRSSCAFESKNRILWSNLTHRLNCFLPSTIHCSALTIWRELVQLFGYWSELGSLVVLMEPLAGITGGHSWSLHAPEVEVPQ